ncbi:Hypothetical predicted protein [Mytilus galloprovincialis]|uniref:CCHC-type domain-containing protein n=1 Tax=Mytilus galloprovincialis TaxID=29158 RepID=A0A8B6DT85_MYTGA|nr:Hypothetical predicted protein [Mytilus galloprovincialis]
MDITTSFFQNISSFIGDFSGFNLEEVNEYTKDCEYYDFRDCTDRSCSYVITFKAPAIFNIFQNILFTSFDQTLFEDRENNGLVFNTFINGQKTVLHIYKQTCTFHVQGKGCKQWIDTYFNNIAKMLIEKVNENTEMFEAASQPKDNNDQELKLESSQTEMKHLEFDISEHSDMVSATSSFNESEVENNKLNPSATFQLTSTPCAKHSLELMLRSEIDQLKKLVSTLMEKANNTPTLIDKKIQCSNEMRDSSTQTEIERPNKDTIMMSRHEISVQTEHTIEEEQNGNRIKSPQQQHKSVPSQSVRTSKGTDENGIKNKIIIGSSILQRINLRGLDHSIKVSTNRGANFRDIRAKLQNTNIENCSEIIIQAGGNDASQKRDLVSVQEDLKEIVMNIHDRSPDTKVFIAEATPRIDCDVADINKIIKQTCENYDAVQIKTEKEFGVNRRKLFWYDGIHLTDFGTAKLLKIYNSYIPILKQKQNNSRRNKCFNCGEGGHSTRNCNFGHKIECYKCGYLGHKLKNCKNN